MTEAPAPAERPERAASPRDPRLVPRSAALGVLVLVAVAVLALVGAGLLGSTHGPQARLRPTGSAPAGPASLAPDRDQQQLDALTAVLAARRHAVLTHDRAAWVATVDPRAGRFRDEQQAVFDHLADVPFSDWSYQYVGRAPDLSPDRLDELGGEAWVARVLAGYRLRGFDTTTSYAEQDLTVVRRGAQWFIASTGDGGTAPQPWDLGPVRVVRGDHVLVLGSAPASALRQYAQLGDRAVRQVSDVWGTRWTQRAVLLAPRGQHEFGQLLLRDENGLDQVAAVTTGDLGGGGAGDAAAGSGTNEPGGRAGNDRVVINPAAFARLGTTGRRVVLTHEMTHVAVRQTTASAVPIWLSEGFADFVGYAGTGVSRRVGAGDLLVQVRAGHGPTRLPTADDFDPTRTTIAPSYSGSWLACSLIADTYGTERLVALYRRAAAPASGASVPDPDRQLESAFRRVLGTTSAAFTRDWLRYLDRLARAWSARRHRLAPWAALGVLTVALVVVAVVVVPWTPAHGVQPTPARDFTAAQLARDTAFHADLRAWTYPRALLVLLVTLALGLTPAGARLVGWCGRRLGGSWPATVVGGTVALTVVTTAVALPFSAAAEVVLRRYGLSTQHWGGWSIDVLRATALTAVVTALGLLLLVGLARRWPTGWWLPGAAAAAALVVVGSALYPLVVEPLSNDFRSMPPSAQRTALLQLAARDGQPVSDVLVADASRRTTAENAYVSGLGATRRLVVYDTLLRGADEREVELVVAHELGHVADHDVARGTALGALGAAWAVVALALLRPAAVVVAPFGRDRPR